MREKYESLALAQLRELAKIRGIKGSSTLKKAELVESMLQEDENEKDRDKEKEVEAEKTEKKQEDNT